MALQDKLERYNSIYRFQENPEHFSFSFSPERVIIRNEALRTGNKQVYETFLHERYPEHADAELQLFCRSLVDTKLVTIDEARDFIERHSITALLADLAFNDKDTIFAFKPMISCDARKKINGSGQAINTYVAPSVLEDRELVWLDISEIRLSHTPQKKIKFKLMKNRKFNRDTVRDLIDQGYQVIAGGVPEKIEGDFWQYLLNLGEKDDVLVLEKLLRWTDDELAGIGEPKAQSEDYKSGWHMMAEEDAAGYYDQILHNDLTVGVGYFDIRTGKLLFGLVHEDGEVKRKGIEGYNWEPIINEVEIMFENKFRKASE